MKSIHNLFLRICFFIILSFFNPVLFAQNFSDLKDKELKKVDDLSGLVTDLLSSKVDGQVDKVTVLYDSERSLKIKIEYTGLETAYIRFNILKDQNQGDSNITATEFSLEGKTSPLEVEFNLKENTPEGTYLETPYLEIKLGQTKRKFPKRTIYSLNKNWKTEINPENLIVQATLEPVGSARDLKENVTRIIYPKKKPVLKLHNYKALSTSGLLSTGATTSTSSTSNSIDGTYNNKNNSRRFKKVIVSDKGKKVEVFQKCSSGECSMGKRALLAQNSKGSYRTSYVDSRKALYLNFDFSDGNLKLLHNTFNKVTKRTTPKQQEIFQRTLTYIPIILPMYTATTETVPEDTNPQGPHNQPLALWEDLVTDVDFEFSHEITNIRMDVYPDKNPASGVFYYLPQAYHLRWNEEEGYNFRMLYNTADSSSSDGDVRMTGTITPSIGTKEIAFIKTLLQSYVKRNANLKYKELKIIPTKSLPKMSLSSGLQGQYDISSDGISVNMSSTINNPIDVSWLTDNNTKEEMQVALSEGVGITGTMTLEPDSETIPEQLIPVRITLADARTLGRVELVDNWRNDNWTNATPFPIKLRYVHALIMDKTGNKTTPLVYSWELGNVELPSKSQVSFDAAKMPSWLNGKAERIWVDYSIIDCESCVDEVISTITNATGPSQRKNISLESFKVFETMQANRLIVKIRSNQADPKGNVVKELAPVEIREDLTPQTIGPLYLPEGTLPQFEYHFKIITEDGDVYTSDNWIPFEELEMFINMNMLKNAISSLPLED